MKEDNSNMETTSNHSAMKILLTGATGYIGGRLLTELESRGFQVRCLVRNPKHLEGRVSEGTELVAGDVLDEASLEEGLKGIDVAYYMVHALAEKNGFEERETSAARNFARAARKNGVKRIIYLGGLGRGELSPHLRSRQRVGQILRQSGVLTIELQASIVIGSGSLSFEMIRSLVNKLPVMITPRWVSSQCQPIAIEDVIGYLVEALNLPSVESRVFEIGGPDQLSYADIMTEYARQRGLKRWIIRVPVLTPRLSSLWLGLISPVYARIGRKLIDSLQNDTLVRDPKALQSFGVRPRSIKEAVRRALTNEDREFAQTRWSDAYSSRGTSPAWGGVRFGTRLVDSRVIHVQSSSTEAFAVIERIGGDSGWYYGDWLWRIRGFLDILVGGVGLRRGRRDPNRLLAGDTVDFWRVEEVQAGHLLRLFAEMRLPGRAWLQFEVTPDSKGCSVRQTAIFDPVGLSGLAYWYSLYPVHGLVFAGMLRGIARRIEGRGEPSARSDFQDVPE